MERIIPVTLLALLPVLCTAKTWQVRPAGPVSSIRQALLLAKPGDSIAVYAGVYLEKGLTIDKAVYLRGIGRPVLDGEGRYEIVNIKSNHVTFEGFLIRHSGYSGWNDIAGIRLAGVRQVVIRNNLFDDTYFGLYCQQADSCTLEYNCLQSRAGKTPEPGNGIHCWHCDHMRILNNTITRHRDGIYFEFVTHSLIRGNNSYYNVRYGLHFMFSHDDRYEGNTFRHNEAGVSVMFSHGVDMAGNTFADNLGGGAYGILLKEITDSHLDSSRFLRNTAAIYMEGTTRVRISGNLFKGNGWALKVQASCSADTMTRNNFIDNTFDVATNGTLVLNSYDGNYWDKYDGYDLNRDGRGDVPYHPVSMYAMIAEKNPAVMMLYHSTMVSLLDKTEKVMPGITPAGLVDHQPFMKPLTL